MRTSVLLGAKNGSLYNMEDGKGENDGNLTKRRKRRESRKYGKMSKLKGEKGGNTEIRELQERHADETIFMPFDNIVTTWLRCHMAGVRWGNDK